MSNTVRNGIIILGLLVAAYFVMQTSQGKHASESNELFSGTLEEIHKILIQKNNNTIELSQFDGEWGISGNDSLVIRQNRLDELFDNVFTAHRGTLRSNNPNNWSKYSVDDSTGTHLALIGKEGETMAYFVFGRSLSDWSHNYVRIDEGPEVYLTDKALIQFLNTNESFWGEIPKPEEPTLDTLNIAPDTSRVR